MQIYDNFGMQHKDLIHDVAYDYYGQSLASCSADREIKVWRRDTGNSGSGGWTCTDSWVAHQGPVWKLKWAHPQYGRIIASCSFDRTVAIWEELNHHSSGTGAPSSASQYEGEGTGNQGASTATGTANDRDTRKKMNGPRKSNWKLRTRRDSQEPVTDIAFAPRSLGLQLATVSGDGYVRIYKPDDTHNLEFWHEQSFEATTSDADEGGSGVGQDEGNAKRGRQLTSISWCEAHFCPPMLAVAAKDGSIRVWAFNEAFERWMVMHRLQAHTGAVHDVAWAPDTGRSFHLLASASADGCLGVWAVAKAGELGGPLPGKSAYGSDSSLAEEEPAGSEDRKISQCMMKADAHRGREVWRVQWDISGMQLASSGDDRNVRLWRKKLQGMEFECFEEVSMDFRVNELEPED